MIDVMSEQINKLHAEYLKTRSAAVSLREFEYLLRIFPSLMICMADGKLDREEWDGVLYMADGLAEEFYDENGIYKDKKDLALTFRTEFRYLLENITKWEKRFINVLKDSIKDNRTAKEFVLETMYLFANVADGISDSEQEAIDALAKRLNLTY